MKQSYTLFFSLILNIELLMGVYFVGVFLLLVLFFYT